MLPECVREIRLNTTGGASPLNYGWKLMQNCFEPDWYPGSKQLPSLESPSSNSLDNANQDNDEVSEGTWSAQSHESDGNISDNKKI